MSAPRLAAVPASSEALQDGSAQLIQEASDALSELLHRCSAEDPLRTGLETISLTMKRLKAITLDVNALGRRKTPRALAIDLKQVVREMDPSLQRLLGPFIRLEISPAASGIHAATDRARVEQIILGLVINAREALPLGGLVRLLIEPRVVESPVDYRIGTLPAGDWAMIEVRDTRAAVDDDTIIQLLDARRAGVARDSTLSLSTISAVVREAGGHLLLDSQRQGETVLAAAIPAAAAGNARAAMASVVSAVLLVEPDEWTRLSNVQTLRRAGFGVLEAGQVDDAMELLHDVAGSCVRLVIADATVALEGTRSLADQLRIERPDVDLVLTSHVPGDTGLGPSALTKPVPANVLIATVRDRIPLTA